MAEVVSPEVEKIDYFNQKTDKVSLRHVSSGQFSIAHQEALRRATLLKHRKVSTQLKYDMVQRQLAELRQSSSSSDRQFYRSQLSELSDELQDLGTTLEKVERNAFYAKKRMLRYYGINGGVQLSASHPAIYSSNETICQSSKGSYKINNRLQHLMSSPTLRFKKKQHLFGELRAVASLSSLHVKTPGNSSCEDLPSKDTKTWKGPLRFLGHIMDNRICRKIWGSKKFKSEENLGDGIARSPTNDISNELDSNGFSSSSSQSESSDDSDEENKEYFSTKTKGRIWKGPVERKVSKSQNQQIDPNLLAEIEDFEKMAAQYVKLHT